MEQEGAATVTFFDEELQLHTSNSVYRPRAVWKTT